MKSLGRFTFSDVFVGLPAGALIFMSTVMFSAVLQNKLAISASIMRWLDLILLAADAAIVGLLCGLTRKAQGLFTAMIAGDIGALVIVGLRIASQTGEVFDPLVFGWPGAVVCFVVTPVAALLFAGKKKEERTTSI